MTDRPSIRPLYYDALKVSQDAPAEVIRAAYRSLSQKHHPDRNAGDESARVMAALNQAYEVLSHPVKKQEYDAWIRRENLRASGQDAQEPESLKPLARRPRHLHKALTRKRILASLSLLAGCAAVVAYSTSQNTDFWLERAWHESWRSNASNAGADESKLTFDRASVAADPVNPASPTLRWEKTLNNSQRRHDVRF
jgi:curved DNA-binding protein CbpA